MASDLKLNQVMTVSQRGPNVHLMGNPAVVMTTSQWRPNGVPMSKQLTGNPALLSQAAGLKISKSCFFSLKKGFYHDPIVRGIRVVFWFPFGEVGAYLISSKIPLEKRRPSSKNIRPVAWGVGAWVITIKVRHDTLRIVRS